MINTSNNPLYDTFKQMVQEIPLDERLDISDEFILNGPSGNKRIFKVMKVEGNKHFIKPILGSAGFTTDWKYLDKKVIPASFEEIYAYYDGSYKELMRDLKTTLAPADYDHLIKNSVAYPNNEDVHEIGSLLREKVLLSSGSERYIKKYETNEKEKPKMIDELVTKNKEAAKKAAMMEATKAVNVAIKDRVGVFVPDNFKMVFNSPVGDVIVANMARVILGLAEDKIDYKTRATAEKVVDAMNVNAMAQVIGMVDLAGLVESFAGEFKALEAYED